MTFTPDADREVAHRLHLAGLAGKAPEVVTTYGKTDANLRRTVAGRRFPAPPQEQLMPYATFDGALSASIEPLPDAGWFGVRWDQGEACAVEEASHRVAAEARVYPVGPLLPDGTTVIQASPAVASGVGAKSPTKVLVSMRAPGALAVLEAIAGELPVETRPPGLPSRLSTMVRRHVAASAVLRLPDISVHVDDLLRALGPVLLPLRGQEAEAGRALEELAASWLDQPPGEARRLASGWHRGRTDRMHRAWLRGFFVPPGFDLDGWVRQRLQARTAGASDA